LIRLIPPISIAAAAWTTVPRPLVKGDMTGLRQGARVFAEYALVQFLIGDEFDMGVSK